MSYFRTLTLIIALAVAGCATKLPGRTHHDPAHDFSGYRTFAWISDHPMKVGPVLDDPRDALEPAIMEAIQSSLESGGYRLVDDAESADFVVSFTVGSREKVRPAGYTSMKPKEGGRWSWGTEYHHGEEGASYTQGVLAIDVFDGAQDRPVWHGVASKKIGEEDRDDMTGLIRTVVASVLSDFPPEGEPD